MVDHSETTEPQFRSESAALQHEAATLGVPLGGGAALCFSGGGIRSATFCLGVAQALARAGVLHRFDYLSTVSGGGYVGGWLQQMLAGSRAADRRAKAVDVEARLYATSIPELDRLRDFTNYLTPRMGPASPDTWAGVALYGRNLLVNWVVFLPLFLMVALLPILHRTLIWALGANVWLVSAFTVAAFGAMGVSVTVAAGWVPSQRQDRVAAWVRERAAQAQARHIVTVCALVYAVSLPVMLQYLLGAGWWIWIEPAPDVAIPERWLRLAAGNLGLPLCFFLTLVMAFEVARFRAPPHASGHGMETSRPRALFTVNRQSWLWAAGVSSAAFALLLQALLWNRGAMLHTMPEARPGCSGLPDGAALPYDCVAWVDARADVLTLGAPLVLILLLLGHSALYIGWRREARFGDLDREWLARLNGTTLGCTLAWTLFAAACILPSRWITLPEGTVHGVNITLSGLSAIASGFVSSWLGKQVVSRVTADVQGGNLQRLMSVAQMVLPLIFVVALFAFLSALIQDILGTAAAWLPPGSLDAGAACDRVRIPAEPCAVIGRWVPVGQQLLLGGLLLAALLKLRKVVNVNRFSMHAVYRNRLVRAFLGTARDPSMRHPDPYTGFDEGDNPRLATLTETGPLFPVVNMTLNITTGERGAWSERKGASFVATPLWCGSGALAGGGAYVPTRTFGGMETDYDLDGKDKGIHLGSVVTISGAAASPNWGYHSSPMIALLMTLFNVRLGAWYANPAKADAAALQLSKPADSLGAMLNELSGTARGDAAAIYLSDGGHFENLGVYEMLKRRCARILVIDAGQDENCGFFDLGMMIRKSEIDLPVKITLQTGGIASRADIEAGKVKNACGFAYGTVTYFDAAGGTTEGEIIYVKPTLLADVPTSVRAYADGSDLFPHEPTTDQFFSESQFESYRALGEYQGRLLAGAKSLPVDDQLAALFRMAKERAGASR